MNTHSKNADRGTSWPEGTGKPLPGLHLMGDFFGCTCDRSFLVDAALLARLCRKLVEEVGLHAVGELFHPFGGDSGVTGVVVLAESHLSLHTWPESGTVTLDVYVCNHSEDNRGKAQQLFDSLMAIFQPTQPHLWRIDRT